MKTPTRGVFEGLQGAYPPAQYRAMGYQGEDFVKPLIGIVNSWREVNPAPAVQVSGHAEKPFRGPPAVGCAGGRLADEVRNAGSNHVDLEV